MADKWDKYSKGGDSFKMTGAQAKAGDRWDKYSSVPEPTKRTTHKDLPIGQQIAEEMVRGRKGVGITQPIREYFQAPVEADLGKRALTAYTDPAKAVLGTAFEGLGRAEATVSNPIRALLAGKGGGEAAMSALRGLKGEEYGKLGDIGRQHLYGKMPPMAVEAISGVGGMAAMSALYGGAKGIKGALKSKTAPEFLKRQAKGVYSSVKNLLKDARGTYTKIYSGTMKDGQVVDDVAIRTQSVREATQNLSKSIKKAIGTKGKMKMKIKDIRKARDVIDDEITKTDWINKTQGTKIKASKDELIQAKGVLKKLIVDNVDETTKDSISAADDVYYTLKHEGYGLTKKVYDPQTNSYNTKGILSWFSDPEKAGKREMFETMANLPGKHAAKLGSIFKKYGAYTAKQKLKKSAFQAAPWAVGAAGLGYGSFRAANALERLLD